MENPNGSPSPTAETEMPPPPPEGEPAAWAKFDALLEQVEPGLRLQLHMALDEIGGHHRECEREAYEAGKRSVQKVIGRHVGAFYGSMLGEAIGGMKPGALDSAFKAIKEITPQLVEMFKAAAAQNAPPPTAGVDAPTDTPPAA